MPLTKIHQLLVLSAFICLNCASNENSQSPLLFNQGRTKCFGGGLAFTSDGKTLIHPITIKSDSSPAVHVRLAYSQWHDDRWGNPKLLGFPHALDVFPVFNENATGLFFTSNEKAVAEEESAGLNIWYTEKRGGAWNDPVFLRELNSNANERMLARDEDGNYYLASDKAGTLDIYLTRKESGHWITPEPVAAWNSSANEEYIAVHQSLGVAIIQRTNLGVATELLISRRGGGEWTDPVPLDYEFKSTELPYVQRWPIFSPDGSTLYLVSHTLIWQYSVSEILASNNLAVTELKFKPLAAAPLLPGEPQLFGGLQLKTNNGIALTADEKEIYLSRYTQEKDSTGNPFIKIFKSTLANGTWSKPQQVSFCKPGVPFEYHPVLSPDGQKFFFNSRAPIPGSSHPYEKKNNIWQTSMQQDGQWSEPWLVLQTTTDDYDDYASVARSGNLYFRSDRPGGLGKGDLYVSRWENDNFQTPENLTALNTADNENDVCIDPEERFIIFNRYFERTHDIKLFLSVKAGDGWTKPRLVDAVESEADWELTPTLSPDGTYFYYEVNSNIYRIETQKLFTREEIGLMAS